MANERIDVVETRRGSGTAGWMIALLLVVALVLGVLFFSRMTSSETAKDNAVANAAQSVGSAAKDVGSAAKDAADGK
ncbi:hypothetical protein [Novosphingobium sp. JCM 18896]|uniref:hypothetical protein n=1 Tax=Novosphingobium sp. JCM 18896 TaxID=2989731 RepID=UPI002223B685|nr:hypothetical protein [Novosphingobium sp. JCM 18896]MCW1432252.1 hypothetical protein [Novosphingobium sp. JCM 18896]